MYPMSALRIVHVIIIIIIIIIIMIMCAVHAGHHVYNSNGIFNCILLPFLVYNVYNVIL